MYTVGYILCRVDESKLAYEMRGPYGRRILFSQNGGICPQHGVATQNSVFRIVCVRITVFVQTEEIAMFENFWTLKHFIIQLMHNM